MDAKQACLEKELKDLIERAAVVAARLQGLEQGPGTPHYDQIEQAAQQVGEQISRKIQTNRTVEVALEQPAEAACPSCSRKCEVEVKRRTVTSVVGPTEIAETVAHCRRCRRSFFPSAGGAGP